MAGSFPSRFFEGPKSPCLTYPRSLSRLLRPLKCGRLPASNRLMLQFLRRPFWVRKMQDGIRRKLDISDYFSRPHLCGLSPKLSKNLNVNWIGFIVSNESICLMLAPICCLSFFQLYSLHVLIFKHVFEGIDPHHRDRTSASILLFCLRW